MSFALDVQTISVVIACFSVVGSAVYYILETRRQRRIRQTEAIIRLSPWFNMNAKDIQEAINSVRSLRYTDYQDYLKKYDGKPQQTSLKLLGNFFEGVGLLVKMKLVEREIVFNFWGDVAVSVWDKNEELIESMRRDVGTPWTFQYWQYLVKEIKEQIESNKGETQKNYLSSEANNTL